MPSQPPDAPANSRGLMMYAFLDCLRMGAASVRALREAQLWLLDRDRVLPDDMPRPTADILHDGDPSALELLAAFTRQEH